MPKTQDNMQVVADLQAAIQFDPKVTIVAINLAEKEGEELHATVKQMMAKADQGDTDVVLAARLRGRGGKAGIVKIQLQSKETELMSFALSQS